MATPTQIAVIDPANHDGNEADAGRYTARILDIGPGAGGVYTLNGVDVAAGALVLPLAPNPVLVTSQSLAVEIIGEEPVIAVGGGGAVSVSIGSGPYAGTYTTRQDGTALTTAMIEAAPTCLLRPVVTGPATVGTTLNITPGLWIYAGADPGDQTWVQRLNGAANGETGLDYVVQAPDAGRVFTVDETFGSVTVTSAATLLSA